MEKSTEKISLAIAMKKLYRKANFFVYLTYFIQLVIFIANLIIILTRPIETPLIIWSILGITVMSILINLYFSFRSKNYYELGERIRKIDMIKKVFPEANNKVEESYVKNKLPLKILRQAQSNPDIQTEYYSDETSKYEKLVDHIQENCYFTSSLMRIYSNIILAVIILSGFTLIIAILFGFKVLSETSDQEVAKSVASYLALFVNFIFALNIFNHYSLFGRKAKELKRIDNDLEGRKSQPTEDEVITIFTEYNCILSDSLPCPDWVYNFNEEKLNMVWKDRIDNN